MRPSVTFLSLLCLASCLARAQDFLPAKMPLASSAFFGEAPPELGQALAPPASTTNALPSCPGAFPTNVLVIDCSFTQVDRWNNFVISSITDEAVLSSVAGSLGSQLVRSPAEWPETWHYYSYRLAASYSGGVARGTAEFLIGSATHSDPRHVRCAEDPLVLKHYGQNAKSYYHCSGVKGQALFRPLHVFTDALTVRRSQPDGDGFRFPAIERYVGIYASAYASYPWQPPVEDTFAAVSRRAGLNYLITFIGSAWNEYGPTITSLFHRTPTRQVP